MSEQSQGRGQARRIPAASRPYMPNYGLKDAESGRGLFPWQHVSTRMARSRNYWIGTTRPDGRPHVAPVWGVWLDDTLYFGTDPGSRKARNLALNPALVVHLESGNDVVIMEGKAISLDVVDRALFDRIADAYAAKYDGFRPDYPTGGDWYWLETQVVFAWLENDFPGTATRWQLPQKG